ncbi:hypothetical protein BBFL7_01960 [Flavobacteria bacterium BBFL7]|nr:hypothetical protein BBFL7_01960 [Flavobacteria bacterium BBFL7]
MKLLKGSFHILIVIILTLLTQVGGLIWILVFGYFKYRKSCWSLWKRLGAYGVIYIICVFTIVPLIAPINDRKMLPVFHDTLKPHNLGYVLMCRNYVRYDLYTVLEDVSDIYRDSKYNGLQLVYLDAGFPFINGFPLLPHFSHNDGRKVDVAFVYKDGARASDYNLNPSLIGYGVYENPRENEFNQTQACEDAGYWQYGCATALGFNVDKDVSLNEQLTKQLVEQIQSHPKVQKVFIEPHLISRLGIKNVKSKLRFHGCHAVRHDDHIHFQVNP